jgi:eukaryotic-like serine/threonine-protein kinase
MDETSRCPGCGRPRTADAPGGLCPACLLKAGLGKGVLGAADPSRQDRFRTLGTPSPGRPSSLLQTMGQMPMVLLRDTDPATGPDRVIEPSAEMPALADGSGRLQLFGVIARGGMGVVLKGRDTELGRDLAVKVLLEQYRDHPELVRRFVEEAQIGGQLQHPGVVPVYELGTFADGRPYIAMKLIKGRTLAELLGGRGTPADERPRLLGIFESVCQTMAYAHVRGVIHRDLKPSNIMVGSFGEVQVMDWGLAKVLTRGGAADDVPAGKLECHRPAGEADVGTTVIATGRRDPDSDWSRPGSILGTPAYMAPEQARGEVNILDERTDVFALGSILCEILTGQPAFTGETSAEIDRRAARGEVAEAHGRLDDCGADAELIALAGACLSAEASGRPRDARVVADRMSAYRIGVQEKLRTAELAAVEAQARAEEEAKRRGLADRLAAEAQARAVAEGRRRRATLGLAASVLAMVVLGGGASAWFVQDRQARLTRAERERQARLVQINMALREVEILRDQAVDDPDGEIGKWQEASRQARKLVAETPDEVIPRRDDLVREIERGIAAAERDRTLLGRLEEIRAGLDSEVKADQAYAEAFRASGLDPLATSLEPAAISKQLADRPRSVAHASAAALDTWASVRRSLTRPGDAGGEAAFRRLLAAARAADPDPWRNRLRDAVDRRDLEALRLLALDKDLEQQGPVSLWLLGFNLALRGDHDRALDVLRRAQQAHPGDFWLNTELGLTLLRGKRWGPGPARVLITDSTGDHEPQFQIAEPYLMAAVALRPQSARAHHMLGETYYHQKKWAEAGVELRQAIRLQPGDALIHNGLGNVLTIQGKFDEAIAAYRRAIQLDPRYSLPYLNLADILFTKQGKLADAIAAYREAIRISPSHDLAHVNLGYALFYAGQVDDGIAEYREAIRLNPKCFLAHANLGMALGVRGDFAEAAAEHRKALELTTVPQRREAVKQDLERNERWAALAPRLPALLRGDDRPKDALESLEFADLLMNRKRFDAAARFFAEALAADPKQADDIRRGNRYNAACSAALAASGRAKDEPPLDDAAKVQMRRRALDWLRADLAAWTRILRNPSAPARPQIHQTLQHWQADPDLAGVRDPAALAQLPEAELTSWRDLWAAVDALLKEAIAIRPAP